MGVFTYLQWDPFIYGDTAGIHHVNFIGIVSQESDRAESHRFEDICAKAEIAFVVFKTQTVIGLDRVKTLIL